MEEQETIERVVAPIWREYQGVFKAVRELIQVIPDEEWIRGDRLGRMPVRLACHLLWALDARSGGFKTKASTRFGVPVGSFKLVVSPDTYPSRQAVLVYVDDVEKQAEAWVLETARKALTGKNKQPSPLNPVIYYLRHTIVHLANLRWEMNIRGIPTPDYS